MAEGRARLGLPGPIDTATDAPAAPWSIHRTLLLVACCLAWPVFVAKLALHVWESR